MKHIILSILIFTLSFSGLEALRPKVDYQGSYLEVTDVERQDTCLRLSVVLKSLPGYWVNIPKAGVYLSSQNDTATKYRIIDAENLELNKRIWMKESGQHKGTLIFEKIPSDVTVLDMRETLSNGKTDLLAVGINLNKQAISERPAMIDPKTIFDTASTDEWQGLDPNRYRDIPYYMEEGKAHIRGRLHDYHPAAGYSTLKTYTANLITGARNTQTEYINPDGTFEFDLNVDYPQYCLLEIGEMPSNRMFVIPGDTIELVTTTLTDYLNPKAGFRKYFGFTGKMNNATAVNLLTDTLRSRYVPDKTTLNKTLSDLPEFLGNVIVSEYVKDILATEAIASIVEQQESNDRQDETDNLIYGNPLAISIDN